MRCLPNRVQVIEAMHDALYAHQDSLAHLTTIVVGSWVEMPDPTSFAECLASGVEPILLQRGEKVGREMRVGATPTVIINGSMLPGPPAGRLEGIVDSILRSVEV